MPATIVPFDNCVILKKVKIKHKGDLVLTGKLDERMDTNLLLVVSTGPGRRINSTEHLIAAAGDANKVPRAPLNVKPGDLVLCQAAVKFYPEGPVGPMFLVSMDDSIIARIEGLDYEIDGPPGDNGTLKLVQ